MPIVILSLLLHAYIGWRVVPELGSPWAFAFGALLVCSALLTPLGLMARRIASQPLADRLAWAGLLAMGLFSSLLGLTLLRDALLALVALADVFARDAPTLVAASVATAPAVPLLGLFVTLVGFVNARRTASVVSIDVPIVDLPPALVGFTIAQITDIHVGPTIKRGYVEAIVGTVNRLGADMVAITGDLVDGPVAQLRPHVAPLARLASRHGTFFVTGNHEYYSGAAGWIVELRRLGVQVLENEHVAVRHGAAIVVVAGVNDYGAHHHGERHRSDPHAAIAGAPAEAGVRLLLAHQPRSAPAASAAGFDLQLSGHTHGGQFLPWNFVVRLQQPFTAGLHRFHALWVYTSRGTGYWGPPKRFGAPSEITRLRLVAPSPA